MKNVRKRILVLVTSTLLTIPSFAQTQNVLVPASSVNGGRAIVAITMPTMPANICTADNDYCITGRSLPGAVAPMIPDQTRTVNGSVVGAFIRGPDSNSRYTYYLCVVGRSDQVPECPSGSGAIATGIASNGAFGDVGGG